MRTATEGLGVTSKAGLRLIEVARPFMQDGEVVEVATIVIVGSILSASGQLGLVGAAVAAAADRSGSEDLVRGKQYLLLTDRRLIFFAMNQVTGRPAAKINAERIRAGLTAGPAKRGLMLTTVNIAVAGADRGMRLRFPLPARADAFTLAEALAGASARP